MFLQLTPEEIIHGLLREHPSEIACFLFQNRIYYSSLPFERHRPMSALSNLIQGVYEKYPNQARSMLRSRIYSTAPASAMDAGMVKVAAKRLTCSVLPKDLGSKFSYDQTFIDFKPSFQTHWPYLDSIPKNQAEIIQTIQNMSQTVYRSHHLYNSDRPVAALLVSQGGEILAWGTNSNSKNRTLHAEVNLLQLFYSKTNHPLPPGSKIYVTLKPCKMCAGMIWSSALDPASIQVFYLEEDVGSMAQQTVLDLKSPERKRISNNQNEVIADILKRIN